MGHADGDVDDAGLGVPGAVGQGFTGDGQDVGGQGFVDDQVDGSGGAKVRRVAELLGVGIGDVQDACLQAGGVVRLQLEDRGADRADDAVQGNRCSR